MAARVVAFLCEKGGAGKSTGATNLASYLAKQGKRVLIVDHDPQASASKWSSFTHENGGPGEIAVIVMKQLQRDLRSISHGFDYVIIDGEPTTDKVTVDAIKVSELVIIPVRPSGFDVWSGINTAGLIRERQELTDGSPKARVLVSQAIVNTVIARDIANALESYQLPLMENRTHIRVAYTEVSSLGKSAFDLSPSDVTRIEMEKVCKEILEILE